MFIVCLYAHGYADMVLRYTKKQKYKTESCTRISIKTISAHGYVCMKAYIFFVHVSKALGTRECKSRASLSSAVCPVNNRLTHFPRERMLVLSRRHTFYFMGERCGVILARARGGTTGHCCYCNPARYHAAVFNSFEERLVMLPLLSLLLLLLYLLLLL